MLQALLMGEAKTIRWDELTVATPYALSQLSHTPRFPLVNTNIGNGQNMLLTPHVPVWHVVTLARPATWGLFYFRRAARACLVLVVSMFACFTVLYLLFEVLFQGNKGIAAFGAFWFCASAYVVCWSLWPAYLTFFIALAVLAFYYLLVSEQTPCSSDMRVNDRPEPSRLRNVFIPGLASSYGLLFRRDTRMPFHPR